MCEKLDIFELGDTISQRRLCWFGHVARNSNQCREIEVEGLSIRGRYIIFGTEQLRQSLEREALVKLMFLTGKSGGNMSRQFAGNAPS